MKQTKHTMWQCPVCEREFAKKSQAHSCQISSLETHFRKASPETLKVYSALETALGELGAYRAVPTKSQINLMVRTSFGGLQMRRNSIALGFVLTRRIEHPRLSALQLSPRTFAYKVQLRSPADVDDQLREWLKEAYQVGLAAGRR